MEYSPVKSEIIQTVINLRALSIKIVRKDDSEEDRASFLSVLEYLNKFPEIFSILPRFISQETDPYILHKEFKELGRYSQRVPEIREAFDKSIEHLRKLNF